MNPEQYARVRALFLEAQSEPDPLAWLSQMCPDEAVRAEVAELLGFVGGEALIESAPPADGDDPLHLVGAALAERYRIEAFVAEGGFGHVYRARHLGWDRPVAVKVFKPYLSAADRAELAADFKKESALLADLSRRTTAIVQSHDLGSWIDDEGREHLYMVLEWLDGQNLAELRADVVEPWPLPRVRAVLAPVAEALSVAHAAGIAHRDVKPDNIFVCGAGGDDETVKLLDFGIAKVAAERGRGFVSTAGKLTAFSVGYAAPEQVARDLGATGPWTDVHGLALVAVELLSGRRPYGSGRDPIAGMRRATAEERPTPGRLGVDLSPAVEAVFARALARQPGDRFEDVAAFWAALAAAIDGRPTDGEARSPGRLRWIAAGLAAGLAAAVAGWLALG